MVEDENNNTQNTQEDANSDKQERTKQSQTPLDEPIVLRTEEERDSFMGEAYYQGVNSQADFTANANAEAAAEAKANKKYFDPIAKLNSPDPTFKVSKKFKSPQRVYKLLSSYVKGQKDAKEVLISAVEVHINDYLSGSEEKSKAHVLLAGRANTGKESLVKSIAKIQDIPFIKVNFQDFYGSKSKDLFSFLTWSVSAQLQEPIDHTSDNYYLVNAEAGLLDKQFYLTNYKKNAHLAIIYFDGINDFTSNDFYSQDKISRDYSKNHLQKDLVSFLSDDIVLNSILDKSSPLKKLSTKHMLFVGAGSFHRLEDVIDKRITGGNLPGFKLKTNYPSAQSFDESKVFSYATVDDFQNFGFIPELIGDFSSFTYTNVLDTADFISILKDKNSYLNKRILDYSKKGINVSIDSTATKLVAQHLKENSSNAGGVKGVVDKLFQPLVFNPGKEYSIGENEVKKYLSNVFQNSK